MDGLDLTDEAFVASDFDQQHLHLQYQYLQPAMSWNMPLDQSAAGSASAADHGGDGDDSHLAHLNPANPLRQYTYNHGFNSGGSLGLSGIANLMQLQQASGQTFAPEPSTSASYNSAYASHLQASPVGFNAGGFQHIPTNLTLTSVVDHSRGVMPYTPPMGSFNQLAFYEQDLPAGIASYAQDLPMQAPHTTPTDHLSSSPTNSWPDDNSAVGSDRSWQVVDNPNTMSRQQFDSYTDHSQNTAINPGLTLHIRTDSGSTQSDVPSSAISISSFEEVQWPMYSPQSETTFDIPTGHSGPQTLPLTSMGSEYTHSQNSPMQEGSSPSSSSLENASRALVLTSPSTSPTSTVAGSPTARRRKSPSGKTSKAIAKKPLPVTKKDAPTDRRVGRRKGPLKPDQRKQASEIRKLRACLRCKFLKKTCDKGDPCAGCQPSHVRLWQVPCTRIDIKDIGDFMKNWKADYERHVSLGFSVSNIVDYGHHERQIWITHGYGFVLPVQAREVFVRDDDCFDMDWVESCHEKPKAFETPTANWATGRAGISAPQVSSYLDQHLDTGFYHFVDKHFEGTKFLTEMLKTAYNFYMRTKLPIIRQALKLVLAYNLTQHVTMIDSPFDPQSDIGRVNDENSNHHGKILAPVMINFEIKTVLAKMWRELQKDVLNELSNLYSSVYSGDKLKNWPTIFMLASILLAVWEEVQFDAHYRSPDSMSVTKFCDDMESTPVGVIVGLFAAISQKVPAFREWNTAEHGQILNNDPAVCAAMTEVRGHVTKYEDYLKTRSECRFDREDFDSLSNKLTSRLVLNSNPTIKCH